MNHIGAGISFNWSSQAENAVAELVENSEKNLLVLVSTVLCSEQSVNSAILRV